VSGSSDRIFRGVRRAKGGTHLTHADVLLALEVFMRQLKYYIACSVDHYIARQDDSLDFFLMEGEHMTDLLQDYPETIPAHLRAPLGMPPIIENKCFDIVLMGRLTYEIGQKLGITSPYPQMQQYLISSTQTVSPDPDVALVTNDPVSLVQGLKQQSGKDIWLCGGGNLATALFSEINEIILKIHPVFLGIGIPLFSGQIPQTSLALVDQKHYRNGFMRLNYRLHH
jgi:dihydrofolate reductase